jgi:hypothetical protein
MLREFARIVADLFPSLDTENAREYLRQLRRTPTSWLELYATTFPPRLAQGDIIRPILFVVEEPDESLAQVVAPAIVLSHSCDIDDDQYIVVAPCFPFSMFQNHRSVGDIRNNTFFSTLYLQSVPNVGDLVVDLSIIQSIRAATLQRNLEKGTVIRVSSFTNVGYYFLIAKLTVRFFRPQPPDEMRGRSRPTFMRRLTQGGRDLAFLARYIFAGSRVS